MRSSKPWTVFLALAALHDCVMALYHFALPYRWGWREGLGGTVPTLVWALFTLNFSWSLLLFLLGSLVLYAAILGPAAGRFARVTVFTVGLFWAIHGGYTWLNPLPMPATLAWLGYILGAFPAVMVALHWIPLVMYRGQSPSEPRP